ncbi:hypothetical protein Hanom_Chr13g01213901 [Helianthus anomalus]
MSCKYRLRKISDILKTLDAADAMVRLRDGVPEKVVGSEEFPDTVPCLNLSGRGNKDGVPSATRIGAGAVLLTTAALMQAFPPDRRCRCRMVYERCLTDRQCANPVGARRTATVLIGEKNDDDLIVDPHPLEWYSEALHTPAEVLAMFSGL